MILGKPVSLDTRLEMARRRLRHIRQRVFDYDGEQAIKAARIIDALKARVISMRPRPKLDERKRGCMWMYACE